LAATLPGQMSYFLNAFLGQVDNLKKIERKFKSASVVSLTTDIALIPMTEDLFNEMNNSRTENGIGKWEFLTTDVENAILTLIGNEKLSYVEVEYFGGEGGQSGIIWKDRKRIFEAEFQQETVNEILRQLGVVKDKKMSDEFDTVGLGRHRNTVDWLK
jgi:hypothetical protein